MSLTSGNSLLFTKQLLRWGLIRKCIFFHFSSRENMKLSSCFSNMELMPQRRTGTDTRLSTWSRWLHSRSFPSKVIFQFNAIRECTSLELIYYWWCILTLQWFISRTKFLFYLIGSWWMNGLQSTSRSQTSLNEGFFPGFFFSRVFGFTEKLIVCEDNRQWPNVRVIDKF